MKKILLLTATLVFGLSLQAQAVPVEFDIVDVYDWGRLYSYDGTNFNPDNINPFSGSAGTSMVNNTFGNADGNEDTWGVAQIDQFQEIGGGSKFFDKDVDPYELTIFFYGFDDDAISSPDVFGDVTIGSVNGRVQIYQDAGKDFDPALGTAGRTAVDEYLTATNGTLLLDLVPVAQNAAGHTLKTDFNFATLVGSGSIFLETTGAGAWDYLFDTNSQLFGSDFSFSFTSRNNSGPTVADWIVRGDGRAESSTAVPEPASMMLLGSGLLGMVGARARRKKM